MAEGLKDRSTEQGVSLTFTGKAFEALQSIAEHENKSLDEVLEDALGLKEWTMRVKEEGDTIIVRHGRKDKYELVI